MEVIQRSNNNSLEVKILIRVIAVSIGAIFIYTFFDFFYLHNSGGIYFSLAFIILYLGCLGLIKSYSNLKLIRGVIVGLMALSITGEFFTNGLDTAEVMDFCNLFLIVSILFNGWERILIFLLCLLFFSFNVYLQFYHQEMILYVRANDTEWFNMIEIVIRFVLAANVGLAVKSVFDKENLKVNLINSQLKDKNDEILNQNEEITQQREEIKASYDKLENLIQERTRKIAELNEKLLEFAFFNSHKIRGPLARILGLVNITNLLKIEKTADLVTVRDYLNKIDTSARQLDGIVREINILLSEREKILNVNSEPKNR